MIPVKTYAENYMIFLQCDGKTHYKVSRATGETMTKWPCNDACKQDCRCDGAPDAMFVCDRCAGDES